jgi:hypothetical protein
MSPGLEARHDGAMTSSHRPEPGDPVSLDAVQDVLTDLVDDDVLTADQAIQVSARLQPLWSRAEQAPLAVDDQRPAHLLTEVAGYVGGALVLSGAAAVVVPSWTWISAPVRFTLALLVTLLLLGGTVALWRSIIDGRSHDAKLRLASTLGALAAGAASIAVAVPVSERWQQLAGSLVALIVAIGAYVLVRGAPLLFAAWLASLTLAASVLAKADVNGIFVWVTVFALVAAVWLVLGSGYGQDLVAEPGVAALLGGLTGFGAAEGATSEGNGMAVYGLLIGIATATVCFGIYQASRRWSALVPAVLIALVVPATALAQLFDSVLGAGLTVAAVGLALLVAGGLALNKKPTTN